MKRQTQNKISKRLSLAEIHQDYPNQWVLVIEPQLDDDLNIIDGEVAYHTSDKEDLYNHLQSDYLVGLSSQLRAVYSTA
jgi:hypothetical protein